MPISVYDAKGYFVKSALNACSFSNLTAKPSSDGSFTIQFGGGPKDASNYLPIMPGWNYSVRMYRPQKEIADGIWRFPEPLQVR